MDSGWLALYVGFPASWRLERGNKVWQALDRREEMTMSLRGRGYYKRRQRSTWAKRYDDDEKGD